MNKKVRILKNIEMENPEYIKEFLKKRVSLMKSLK